MIYISPRIYGGHSLRPLNSEPHAYETGFAVKWLIADQIAGYPELNYDPAKGSVRAAWLAWGRTSGRMGVEPGKAGLVSIAPPSRGPSRRGARHLLAFFQRDHTTVSWFAKH